MHTKSGFYFKFYLPKRVKYLDLLDQRIFYISPGVDLKLCEGGAEAREGSKCQSTQCELLFLFRIWASNYWAANTKKWQTVIILFLQA